MINNKIKNDIKKLDNNAKIILKHSLFIGLGILKKQEESLIEIIKELEKEGEEINEGKKI